jgi:hypothetical protein
MKSTEWNTIKGSLQGKSPGELIGLVKDLYGLSDDNRNFLEARVKPDPKALKKYKAIISDAIYPDFCNDRHARIDFAKARKAISDFGKASDDPESLLDLMTHYVEVGTRQTKDVGIDYEAYFTSMESMFGRIVKQLHGKNRNLADKFLPRLKKIIKNSGNAGYGYEDTLTDLLEEAFGEGVLK